MIRRALPFTRAFSIGSIVACVVLTGLIVGHEHARADAPSSSSSSDAGSPPSNAEEEGSLGSTLTGEAKALYEIARRAFQANDPAAALPKFQRAYEISNDPRLLWNMGACEAALKHWARASTLVDRYVATGGALLGDRDREKAARFRAAAKPLVAAIALTTKPAGIAVAVDGETVGTTPFDTPLYLDAGRRRVHFTKQGYRGIIRVDTATGGSELAWTIALDRLQVRALGSP